MSVINEHDLEALRKVDLQEIQRTLANEGLWTEISVLERLVYKNRSQHRSTPYFKGLLEVHRHAKMLRELNILDLISSLESKTRLAVRSQATADLPSRQDGAVLLYRLVACCRTVEQTLPAIRRAACRFSGQLAESYFMPLSLTAIACLSRINALLILQATEAAKAFNILVELLPLYPLASVWSPAAQHICDTTSDRQLPSMLKCTWDQGLLKLHQLVFGKEQMESLMKPCMGGDIGAILARGERSQKGGGNGAHGEDLLPVFIDRGPANIPEYATGAIQYVRSTSSLPLLGSWERNVTDEASQAPVGASNATLDMQTGHTESEVAPKTQERDPSSSSAPREAQIASAGELHPQPSPASAGSPSASQGSNLTCRKRLLKSHEAPAHEEASNPPGGISGVVGTNASAGVCAGNRSSVQSEKQEQKPHPKKSKKTPSKVTGVIGDIFAALLE